MSNGCVKKRYVFKEDEAVDDPERQRAVNHDLDTGLLTEVSGGVHLANLVGQSVIIAYG